MKYRRTRARFRMVSVYIVLSIFLFPSVWLILTSLRIGGEINATPPVWIPRQLTLEHYQRVLTGYGGYTRAPFLNYLFNSLLITVSSTSIVLIIGTLASFSFARHKFKWHNAIFFSILLVRVIPGIALSLPLLILFSKVGLVDTKVGLILTYVTVNAPFIVWLMEGFFNEIPRELNEAALMDGCSYWQSFTKVDLPLARPGLAVSGMFAFLLSWNEFPIALILCSSLQSRTVPVGLWDFVHQFSIEWGPLTAAGTMSLFPIVLFTFLVQKHIVKGLTFGAIK